MKLIGYKMFEHNQTNILGHWRKIQFSRHESIYGGDGKRTQRKENPNSTTRIEHTCDEQK